VSVDLQDLDDIDDAYRAEFVAAADVLFMSGANLAHPESAAAELAARRGGRIAVVGDGPRGCLVAARGRVDRYPAVTLPRPIVDTNGAGDNLAVGLLVAHLLDGLPLARSVQRAQLGARWICSQRGDAKSPLTRGRLAALEAATAIPVAYPASSS
jgi:sugar/nucleoside kinase (ribokinase family)